MIYENVRIGGTDYDVIETDETITLGSQVCVGLIEYESNRILLNNERGYQSMEKIWWHEVVHAIVQERGIEWNEKNEIYTEELAKGLYALMKNNPYLLPGQDQRAIKRKSNWKQVTVCQLQN